MADVSHEGVDEEVGVDEVEGCGEEECERERMEEVAVFGVLENDEEERYSDGAVEQEVVSNEYVGDDGEYYEIE